MSSATATESGRGLTRGRLAGLVSCCCLFVLAGSFAFQSYVMPQLGNDDLSIAERMRSGKFGDTYGYGMLAEGILEHGRLSQPDGTPIVKHMLAIPLLVAASFRAFDTLRPLMVFQVVFLFVSLFFLLDKVKDGFPPFAIALTPILIAAHPQTIKHASAMVSDMTLASMLLWVVFVLWNRSPGYREFFKVGVILGLAVYIREAAFPIMLMTALAYVVRDFRRYIGPAAVMGCVFLALLSPWTVRNYRVTGEFIPLTTKSTDLFYHSSIPLTPRQYVPFGPGFQEGGYDYPQLYVAYHREALARGLPVPEIAPPTGDPGEHSWLGEIYDPWRARPLPASPLIEGMKNYMFQPAEQALSFVLKTIALFNKPPILSQLASSPLAPVLVAGNIAFYAFHVGVILLGVVLSFTARHNPFVFLPYWIAAQYAQSLLFWSEHRYLMPFYPLLILIALTFYWNLWKDRRRVTV